MRRVSVLPHEGGTAVVETASRPAFDPGLKLPAEMPVAGVWSSSPFPPGALAIALLIAGCGQASVMGDQGSVMLAPPDRSSGIAAGARVVPATGSSRPAAVESFSPPQASVTLNRSGRVLPVARGDRQVQLDYNNAEAVTTVRQVVGDLLNLPVDIDPGLSGRITLQTDRAIPLSEVPARLDQALAPLGFGIAAVNGTVRVGRIAALDQPGVGGAGAVRLIPLRNISPRDLLPVLQQNAPEGTRITVDPAGRGLLVAGQPTAIAAVQELVQLFDVDTLRSRSFGLYPLMNASPTSVLRELSTIYGDNGGQGVRFAVIDRLNGILVVTDQPGALERVRRTLTQLDIAPTATANIRVYPLQNRNAAELAEILSRTFGASAAPAVGRASPAGDFGALQIQPGQQFATGIPTRIPGAPPPPPEAANAAPPPVTTGAQQPTAAELGLAGPIRIQADPGRNALVILASTADYGIIERTIRQLDVRPRQVFIQAVIAEVTLTDALEYGVDASLRLGSSSIINANLGVLTGGIAYVLNNRDIAATLRALSGLTTVRVVSAPRLLVLDNQTATLQVGNQIPILTRIQQSTDNSSAPVVNSVELRDTGVILAVRARVGSGGAVSLDVFQEVSNAVTTDSSTINSPTIQLRRLQSNINVANGDTVALGGLFQDNRTASNSGIPVLSRIPVLGALFGTRRRETSRSELLLFMTPHVVANDEEARSLAEELRAKMSVLAPDVASTITPLPRTGRATLPPFSVP